MLGCCLFQLAMHAFGLLSDGFSVTATSARHDTATDTTLSIHLPSHVASSHTHMPYSTCSRTAWNLGVSP